MTHLQIAPNFCLPPEAVTETFAILAKRGSGKTYCAAVMVEEMLKARLPVVVVDPVGVWWGLRVSADGAGPGLPIVILGGDHADAPLTPAHGAAVADLLVDEPTPLLLDLSLFEPAEQTHFMADFAGRLYHRNRRPLHLVLDEADQFVPQTPGPGQGPLLSAMNRIVRLGRARGLGVTLISQRPAVLSKNVLTQTEVLVTLRLTSPQDRKAVDAWVSAHGTAAQREAMLTSLPSLPVGTAWFWSPGWLDVFRQVPVRRRETFDSSATPKLGMAAREPRTFAAVDLARLRARLADAGAENAAAHTLPFSVQKVIERVEVPVPVLTPEESQELRQTATALLTMAQRLLDRLPPAEAKPAPVIAPLPPTVAKAAPLPPPIPQPRRETPGDKMPLAERKILTALAQYPQGRQKNQVALLTGYAVTGGSFNNALSALRTKGWLTGGKDALCITDEGRRALGTWQPLPTGPALLAHWQAQLPKAERTILQALADAYPAALTKPALAQTTGYAPDGGGFNNALSRLRTLELIEGKAEMRASTDFQEQA